jgi:hypothetical protein
MTEMLGELPVKVAADGVAGLVGVNDEFIARRVRLVLGIGKDRKIM